MARLNLVERHLHAAAGREVANAKTTRPLTAEQVRNRPAFNLEARHRRDVIPQTPPLAQPNPRRHAERDFRTPPPVPRAPAPRPKAPVTPPPAKAPDLDVARLDAELWKRFEKRIRIERERRGR